MPFKKLTNSVGILPAKSSTRRPLTIVKPCSLQPPLIPIPASNYSSYPAINTRQLQRCYTLKDLKATHATMIKDNTHQDSFSMNQFLTACARLRHMDFAVAAFTRMLHPNIFVYNAILGGLVQSNEPVNALHLFVEMPKSARLRPTRYTFSFLIKACQQALDVGFGEAVHGQVLKMGFGSEIIIQTGLIDFYSSSGRGEETKRVFDDMGESRDVFSWNSMVVALSRLGHLDEARSTFDEMPEKNIVSWNTMIMAYAKCGDVESARCLFSRMPAKNLFSWTSMISCFSHNKCFKEAVETFEWMKAAGIAPDQVTMATVIAACAHLGALEVGKKMHHYAMLSGFELDVYIGSALVDMYAKCGSLEQSLVLFFKLEEKNLFCWNSVIDGLAIHGHGREALDMFRRMKQEAGIEPNWVSFVSVLSACAHSGLVEEGHRMFSSMVRDHSISPKMEHYCCMVDVLGRAGLLDEALDVIGSMKMEPNAVVWGALLGGCKIHGSLEIGKIAIENLLALDPERSSNYMMLVNMYAEVNKWPEVATVRSAMKDNRVLKRSPGLSWMEINGRVHEFAAASDACHSSCEEIGFLLTELDGQLKLVGNVSDWSSLHLCI
ncbi:uncharacterized protein A4U43_C07F18650 [Asparagus officinalis]|uniref:Pentacotripeptide-repeat region of PRORP domain-containing protein n=1 Tax=Asparagus officinalis TaxID=4686 RepID=A0A5P1EI65_ASPOF|nr:pentatricopeptide repeat-containing protein At1g06143 [Asparagus officinalis]ONK63760.1 uncharacterized protein A4U43_C07F18650 [Asparagus officinalis]